MPNMIILSDNEKFLEDLTEQITIYAPEYAGNINVAETVPDVIIIDGRREKDAVLKNNYPHTPIFVLEDFVSLLITLDFPTFGIPTTITLAGRLKSPFCIIA